MFPAVTEQIISAACSSMDLMPSIGQVIHMTESIEIHDVG